MECRAELRAVMTGEDPVKLCLSGCISPRVAVARLLLDGWRPEDARRHLDNVPGAEELRAISGGGALEQMRALIDGAMVDHADAATTADIAAMFDRAVCRSPEASVALYTLGDPAVLEASTREIVAWLRRKALLQPGMDVLDLGCGIGRIGLALAGEARSVVGVDVSPAMVREAERRAVGLSNIRFAVTDGQDLSVWADDRFDLVLAVDCFPYLVQAGVAERHVRDIGRMLRPGGVLVIFNLTYRRDFALDCRDARRWGDLVGMELRIAEQDGFRLWDAAAFVLSFRTELISVGSTTGER